MRAFLAKLGPDYRSTPIFGASTIDNPAEIDRLRQQGYTISYTTMAAPPDPAIGLTAPWFVDLYQTTFLAGPPPSLRRRNLRRYLHLRTCYHPRRRASKRTAHHSRRRLQRHARPRRAVWQRRLFRGTGCHGSEAYDLDPATHELKRSAVILRTNSGWIRYSCDIDDCKIVREGQNPT